MIRKPVDVLAKFSEPVRDPTTLEVFNRQITRCGNAKDDAALVAWQIRVISVAKQQAKLTYENGTVDKSFLREVVHLSFLNDGPKLVQEFLAKNGIHLVIERHLPKTYLDGTAMRLGDDGRLVAMTLRHDRIDNFWFVLLHELAHIALHLDKGVCQAVFDNLDERGADQIEREADAPASDSLIPKNVWRAAKLTAKSTFGDVKSFADHHRIHPSIPVLCPCFTHRFGALAIVAFKHAKDQWAGLSDASGCIKEAFDSCAGATSSELQKRLGGL